MRRNQTTEETDDESGSLLDRVRGGSEDQPTDESDSLFERARGGSADATTDSGGLLDRGRGDSADTTTNDSGSWFDRAKAEYGLGTLLVAAGAVLFLFPEPITSTAGIVLIGVGVLVWLLG
ncbi:hypothetical protein [Natrinema sp. 1APR25-10V2]|uniref:hypothetical protein n=1 Tax=Natrinema sp. 1APR25-10V2 TaxID=2951081 RepID=UPI0028765278|nr:hypothetical protein [Natrinema sp. 1APR25-10V2]MDS0475330.1 hypothetical protein [Natrinema sp. 1APR25-10V2]